jgi:hypothetical protein
LRYRTDFIFVKNSLLYFYRKVPLYYYADNGECVLYKPTGIALKEMRIKKKLLPKKLCQVAGGLYKDIPF